MIIMGTILDVADNSGAKKASMIGVIGRSGRRTAEIGDIMGRSEGAIKSLYHRTLLSLRSDLSKNDYPEPKRRTFFRRRG